nr:MAG TPA: hypothetical protein [Caudoviricetes sp.]
MRRVNPITTVSSQFPLLGVYNWLPDKHPAVGLLRFPLE